MLHHSPVEYHLTSKQCDEKSHRHYKLKKQWPPHFKGKTRAAVLLCLSSDLIVHFFIISLRKSVGNNSRFASLQCI